MADLSGQILRSYAILHRIGAGGQGVVYKARHIETEREVSLKVIRDELASDADTVRRFQMEAVVVFMIKHPNIVPLLDYWHDQRGVVIIMRWMAGGNLRQQFTPGGWETPRVMRMLEQLTSALRSAHAIDVIHRDIKPDNILFDELGNAYLTDFGVAKLLRVNLKTSPGTLLGTPAYYSPEQLLDLPITPRTDVYTLGITLYETLTGQHPYHGTAKLMLAQRHVRDPIPDLALSRPDLPPMLNAVLQKATAKKPAERYASIDEFADAFRTALVAMP